MCHSGGEIQISTRAFSAVTLAGGAAQWMLFAFPRENEMHLVVFLYLPNPDLPCDKTESLLTPG